MSRNDWVRALAVVFLGISVLLGIIGAVMTRWELVALALTVVLAGNIVIMRRYVHRLNRDIAAVRSTARVNEDRVQAILAELQTGRKAVLDRLGETHAAVTESRRQEGDRHARTRRAIANLYAVSNDTRAEVTSLSKTIEGESTHLATLFETNVAVIRDEMSEARRREGERHARTRKALENLLSIETTIGDQVAALLKGAEAGERKLLGVIESERIRLHHRQQEILRTLSEIRDDERGGA